MLSKEILIELQVYVDSHMDNLKADYMDKAICFNHSYVLDAPSEVEEYIKHNRKPTFNQVLFGYIDKKAVSDPDLYKQAGIDRKLFSKIRSNPDYHPSKKTVVVLALALALNKEETDRLLSAAGYALSESDTFDLVIQFCLEKRIYNLYDVDAALDYFSLKPLVGVLE